MPAFRSDLGLLLFPFFFLLGHEGFQSSLFRSIERRQLEGGSPHELGDRPTADTLRANPQPFGSAVGSGDPYPLQIWPELPSGNSRDLRTHTAEVLGLSTLGDLIAHDGFFATDITRLSHG